MNGKKATLLKRYAEFLGIKEKADQKKLKKQWYNSNWKSKFNETKIMKTALGRETW